MPQFHPPYYSPFGSSLPNRTWSDGSRAYRFRFNGKEKDSETASDNFPIAIGIGARIYDGRLGRWLSLDPMIKEFVGFSAYNFGLNNPVFFIDPDGNEIKPPTKAFVNSPYYDLYKSLSSKNSVYKNLISNYKPKDQKFTMKLDYSEGPKPSSENAYTILNQTNYYDPKTLLFVRVKSNLAESYFKPSITKIEETIIEDGKSYIQTKTATKLFMAQLLIHEALHAKIATNKNISADKGNHNSYTKDINKVYQGLVEYNKTENLGLSDVQLKQMSWVGCSVSENTDFKAYINGLVKDFNANLTPDQEATTYEKEYKKWYDSTQALMYNVSKEEKVTPIPSPADSTFKKD
jgi:RHS repeat-associated protein